jgi:coenzyme F420-reducing hydrogenase alpha subunit
VAFTHARAAADEAGLGTECRNPFRSIVVRGVELVYAVEEALRLIEAYEPPAPPRWHARRGPRLGAVRPRLRAVRCSTGTSSIRTARWCRLESCHPRRRTKGDRGRPASFVEPRLGFDDHRLTHECEQAIRNYDPCISCSTHFLNLTVEEA